MLLKNKFSIADLEIATGIKAGTIRIWEKRYKILNPKRGSRNIRYYDINEFKKMLNISLLYHQGLKISNIAALSERQLNQKINEIAKQDILKASFMKFISSIIEINIDEFEKLLAEAINSYGLEKIYEEILIPILEKIGLFWQSETICPGEEHIFVNIIREAIIKNEKQDIKRKKPLLFLLFLCENELHEVSLLLARYIIQKCGHKVIYLGQATPIQDIILLTRKLPNINYLLTSFVAPIDSKTLNEIIEALLSTQKPIMIIGRQVKNISFPKRRNLNIFTDIGEFKKFIYELA
ncbi:DNA-binding transcriptional regulator, MerR family [Candidatus Kryptobacter tengchongensis]|nr:DNA-binding transcriptional regulator, MerR family [Candidatus Kryptobacter tengchongensis]